MLIAHGPAGYLIGVVGARMRGRPELVAAGIAGGLCPDLDAVGYHLGVVEGFHRMTPLHWPLVWTVLVVIGVALIHRHLKAGDAVAVFAIAGLIHCGLDATMAPLYWAAPVSWQTYELVHVPGGWSPYWLGFIFYWTFLLELVICAAAFGVWHARKHGGPARETQPG